jgi:hypothetical protein
MATRVNVTSIESVEIFRASLIVYLSKARPTLEEVSSEIAHTRVWLECTQRVHWEEVVKRCSRQLEEAQAALFSANMSNLAEVTSAEQMAVTKAKRAREAAEEKLRMIKRWDRNFESEVAPLARQLDKLQTVFTDDLAGALAYLSQALNSLEAYAGLTAPSLDTAPATGAGQQPPDQLETTPDSAADNHGGGQ